mgnify:CR=1 FL=1
MYASQKVLQRRLQSFAEAYNDPREFRLADVEPDIETRVFLLKKKLWELRNVDRTDRADS